MRKLKRLLDNNQAWVSRVTEKDPNFFSELSKQQLPEILWIGCSDSRVPANQIVGLLPGELFVHRNVANVVVHSDLNCLSVMQFAVEVLKIKHIIVCGHYGCGGVVAALEESRFGLIENWVGHIVDIKYKHSDLLEKISDEQKANALCELNVIEQAMNVCSSSIVKDAWSKNSSLCIHGWIYDIADGLLKDLGVCIEDPAIKKDVYKEALANLPALHRR
ncbi:MAG: carbonate dehydratase [Bdellovibrionales bacterium]|nr:carbonate dehydratase [Bdellovibrionales bacterium]